MTVLTRTPENTNLLQPTKFLVTFDRIPTTQYFCQEANIPGMTMPQAEVQSPFHNYSVAGLNIQYNELEISFLLDEELQTWIQLYNWFLAISSPVGFEQRNMLQAIQNQNKNGQFPSYSDVFLTVLSNLNNPITRVHFYNAFPTSLSDIKFSTKESADDVMTATATFNYEYFEFENA
jgi:T4-like virus tail tube protein gp19